MSQQTTRRGAQLEALRLLMLPPKQARAVFADRVARAFLAEGDERALQLDFNARVATELRLLAESIVQPHIWSKS